MNSPDNFTFNSVVETTVGKVATYNRYLSAFKSPRFWISFTCVNVAIGMVLWCIATTRMAILLIAVPSALHLLAMRILSKEDTSEAIVDYPYGAALYSFFYGGSIIYLDDIPVKGTAQWNNLGPLSSK